jgi:hypothetical protein
VVSPDVAQPGVGAGSRERARARTIQRRLEGAVKAR